MAGQAGMAVMARRPVNGAGKAKRGFYRESPPGIADTRPTTLKTHIGRGFFNDLSGRFQSSCRVSAGAGRKHREIRATCLENSFFERHCLRPEKSPKKSPEIRARSQRSRLGTR